MEHKIYLQDICRLCLNTKSKMTTQSLLEITKAQVIKFESVTNLKLSMSPKHPCNVCGECSDNLENFHFYRNILLKKQKQLSELLEGNEVQGIDFEICCVTVKEETDFIDESEKKAIVCLPKAVLSTAVKTTNVPPVPTQSQKPAMASVDPIKIPVIQVAPKTIISVADLKNLPFISKPKPQRVIRIPVKKIAPSIPPSAPRETLQFDRSKPMLVITPKYLKTLEQQRANSMQVSSLEGSQTEQIVNPTDDDDVEFLGDTNDQFPSEFSLTKEWVNCHLCGAGVNDDIDRDLHIKLAHPERIKFKTFNGPFQCTECQKLFKLEAQCRLHIRAAHINVKTRLCEKCGRSFRNRERYFAHVAEHVILKCTFPGCEKLYNGKQKLKNHLETHLEASKRKSLICDKCASRYINKDNLRIHMRQCDGKVFKDHTLIKPKRKQMKLME